MATTVPIVTEVTTLQLEALVSASDLNIGLQYKNTDTGKTYVATSANTLRILVPYRSWVGLVKVESGDVVTTVFDNTFDGTWSLHNPLSNNSSSIRFVFEEPVEKSRVYIPNTTWWLAANTFCIPVFNYDGGAFPAGYMAMYCSFDQTGEFVVDLTIDLMKSDMDYYPFENNLSDIPIEIRIYD